MSMIISLQQKCTLSACKGYTHKSQLLLYNDPVPDSYLLHAFVIENAYKAAASREPKSGSLYMSEFQHSLQGIYILALLV